MLNDLATLHAALSVKVSKQKTNQKTKRGVVLAEANLKRSSRQEIGSRLSNCRGSITSSRMSAEKTDNLGDDSSRSLLVQDTIMASIKLAPSLKSTSITAMTALPTQIPSSYGVPRPSKILWMRQERALSQQSEIQERPIASASTPNRHLLDVFTVAPHHDTFSSSQSRRHSFHIRPTPINTQARFLGLAIAHNSPAPPSITLHHINSDRSADVRLPGIAKVGSRLDSSFDFEMEGRVPLVPNSGRLIPSPSSGGTDMSSLFEHQSSPSPNDPFYSCLVTTPSTRHSSSIY